MSLITSPTLDIQQDPAQILLDKINVANSLNLTMDDFTIGNPSIYVPGQLGVKHNTKVTFTPKLASTFYNSIDLYYERMDIAPILGNLAISVPREGAEHLTDLITSINEKFGIHLIASDLVEVTLPVEDPMDPDAPVDVDVTIQGTSLLFRGNYTLTLNRLAIEPAPYDPDPSDVVIVIDQPNETVNMSTIRLLTSSGDPVSEFVFMRNAVTKQYVKINKVIKLKNNNLVCFGEFDYNVMVGGTDTHVETNCIVLTPQGTISRAAVDASDDYGFSADPDIKHFTSDSTDYVYAVSMGNIFRFDQNGVITTFATPDFDFDPAFLQLDRDGKIYVVSPVYDTTWDSDNNPNTPMVPVKQSEIHRLLTTGVADSLFTPVVIRATGGADPWPILALAPIEVESSTPGVMEASGFFIAMKPEMTPSSLEDCPIINNVPVVPVNTTLEYGYAPVFRFLQSGIRDITFVNKQPRFRPEAVYDNADSTLQVNHQAVVVQGVAPVFLTNRANPMTGHVSALPVRYKASGEMETIGGEYYFQSFRWEDAKSILKLTNGDMLIFGRANVPLPDGTLSTELRSIVVSYNASTVPDSVLFLATSPNTVQQILAIAG